MKIKTIILGAALIGIFSSSSCSTFCENGSGEVVEQVRELEAFTKIDISSKGNFHIKQGTTQSVMIKTDDNLQELVTAHVKKGRLVIDNDKCIETYTELDVFITLTDIDLLIVSNQAMLKSSKLTTEELEIETNDASQLDLTLDVKNLQIEITGTSQVKIAGKVIDQEIEVNDSATLDAKKLKSQNTDVLVTDAANCVIYTKNKLDARVKNSGRITYKGKPKQVNSKVDGVGSITEDNTSNIFDFNN